MKIFISAQGNTCPHRRKRTNRHKKKPAKEQERRELATSDIRSKNRDLRQENYEGVLPWNIVDNSSRPLETHFGPVFRDEAVQRSLLFREPGSF
jgi:hypothetical protein